MFWFWVDICLMAGWFVWLFFCFVLFFFGGGGGHHGRNGCGDDRSVGFGLQWGVLGSSRGKVMDKE